MLYLFVPAQIMFMCIPILSLVEICCYKPPSFSYLKLVNFALATFAFIMLFVIFLLTATWVEVLLSILNIFVRVVEIAFYLKTHVKISQARR